MCLGEKKTKGLFSNFILQNQLVHTWQFAKGACCIFKVTTECLEQSISEEKISCFDIQSDNEFY